MKIKKGTKLIVNDVRKGVYHAVAVNDFDTCTDEFYPVIAAQTVYGLVNEWEAGELVPCRKSLAKIEIFEGEKR